MVKCGVLVALVALVHLGQCSQIVPPLYRYDDFFRCQREDPSGVYCFVKVVFRGNQDSFDSPRIVSDFRHNLLDWGICVNNCQRELSVVPAKNHKRLYQFKFPINHTYILPKDLFDTDLDNLKPRYSALINICVNNRLELKYNLSQHAYSEIEYCTTRDDLESSEKTLDLPETMFYITVFTLASLFVGANVIDWIGHDHAKGHIVVTSFSVRRNWSRLTEQPKSELYRNFGYIDGVRVYASVFLIIMHCAMYSGVFPVANPEYGEQVLKNPLLIDVFALAVVVLQMFFVISGLLLAATVLQDVERKPDINSGYFWTKIRMRLIRIVPVYFFCLLLTMMGANLPGVQLGPVGYKTLVQEQVRCKQKWWTNVLFVNNLPTFGEERCHFHGWYLATDFQLFLATLLLLSAFWKSPKRANALLSFSVLVALIVPTGIVYYMGLESAFPLKLSEAQFSFMYSSWINHVYFPSYSNMNSYLLGAVVGYVYHQTKYNKLNLDDYPLYSRLRKLCLPLLALAYLPTFIFYQYEIPRSSWITILHNFLYRNVGVAALCVCFIECFRNPPGQIRAHLSSVAMTSLGKLSYNVYVLHIPVIRLILNMFSPSFKLSLVSLLWIPQGVAVISYFVGFVAFLLIEQPLGLLLKHRFVDQSKPKLA
ncbi:nose resistant to fluoxetine protein 6 [Culex quinquefasciatus]|uniref:nose resistant to fluoxetine protein 6 n=1 Tax=Culex quinquefasciatus TaxID=7176 RepID=UPI0018E39961|nr:nose resistant to fluoxetine protein 6 [Culex quinquefasciatus]